MITVTLRTFARYRELLGFEQARITLVETSTLATLLEHPELAKLPAEALLAVNQAFAQRETVLADGDEVALMPPVSGG